VSKVKIKQKEIMKEKKIISEQEEKKTSKDLMDDSGESVMLAKKKIIQKIASRSEEIKDLYKK
jgi:hypothetical protein